MWLDPAGVGHDHRALDDVLQLADVARIAVAHEPLDHGLAQRLDGLAQLVGEEPAKMLAEHFRGFFADKLGKSIEPLGGAVTERLLGYGYPGNVRELKNIIERAVIMTDAGRIELHHLPQRVLEEHRAVPAGPAMPYDFVPGVDTLETLEQRMIEQAMRRAGGVRTRAAKLLGISRFQLLRRMEKYGIRPDDDE